MTEHSPYLSDGVGLVIKDGVTQDLFGFALFLGFLFVGHAADFAQEGRIGCLGSLLATSSPHTNRKSHVN